MFPVELHSFIKNALIEALQHISGLDLLAKLNFLRIHETEVD